MKTKSVSLGWVRRKAERGGASFVENQNLEEEGDHWADPSASCKGEKNRERWGA